MKLLYARYNMYHNSIDITTFDGYILRIGCSKAERLKSNSMDGSCAKCYGNRQST